METIWILEGAGPEKGTHSHDFWEFHAVAAGPLRASCRGKAAVLGTGDVFFVPGGVPHRVAEAAGQVLTVRLDPNWLLAGAGMPGELALSHPEAFGAFLKKDAPLFSLVLSLADCCRRREFGWELTARGLALELAGALLSRHCDRSLLTGPQPRDSGAHYARWIRDYIESHYHASISLDHLASELGLTKGYLCRVFKEHTGATIIGYVNRIRCEKAIGLVESGHTVTQAALQVGFNDYNYFSRVFKKTMGKRPSDFMEAPK